MRTLLLLCLASLSAYAQPDTLLSRFQTPPPEARPRTWWHWVGGNVTKDGITKDLEWMKRAGIGGFQAFDVSLGMGQSVDNKLVFMSPAWLDAIQHTAAEAERLGLEMTMVTSAGWSETGGPWVKPEEAMKKIVWSEVPLTGGKSVSIQLPNPPRTTGPIRNLKRPAGFGGTAGPEPTLYEDIAVVAFPTPPAEIKPPIIPVVTSALGNTNADALFDDDLQSGFELPMPSVENPVWIEFDYGKQVTMQHFSLALALTNSFGSKDMCAGAVQYSSDGTHFTTLLSLPGPQHDIRAIPVRTYSFPAITARYFRIIFEKGSGLTTVGEFGSPGFFGPAPSKLTVTEARFGEGARVHRWEDKAHFAPMFDLESLPTPKATTEGLIYANKVVDVTQFVDATGKLVWQAPSGNWTVMRFGYSLTGAKNSPAMPAGVGLEVDKLSRKHLTSYYKAYTEPIANALGKLYGKRLQYWLTDSFEADAQNWTEEMPNQFVTRRGYSLIQWLPVLSGRVVNSAEQSDRFLWDFRKTISDLLADDHYGALAELAKKDGIGLYGESAGISLPILQDALRNKSFLDIPMSEFGMTQGLGSAGNWMSPHDLEQKRGFRSASDRLNAHQSDVREAASAAHIFGKKFVAAESWTGGAYEAPSDMKLIGDYWATQGINRFVFHTSTHQPLDTKPGNSMVGTHMHRNITWAEQARPFVDYLSRTSYLLQQGQFVGDILLYLGEAIPSAVPYWKRTHPEIPRGYDYDYINTDVLINALTVKEGKLVLPTGASYEVLVLPADTQMNVTTLRKVKELIVQGATVVGPQPTQAATLHEFPMADAEILALAKEVWGGVDGKMIFHRKLGKGQVYTSVSLDAVLSAKGVQPDLAFTQPHLDTYLSWIHRRANENDIYFLVNMRKQQEKLAVTFRVTDRVPEIWNPGSGSTYPVTYRTTELGIEVLLDLQPEESLFVVFRKSSSQKEYQAKPQTTTVIASLAEPWSLSFPDGWGAPPTVTLSKLISWTDHSNKGVKYFSGTAEYRTTFTIPKNTKLGESLRLDLGEVNDLAEVTLNGKVLETRWKSPFVWDVSGLVKSGTNKLRVRVTNQWTNRIAGDAVDPETKVLSGAGFAFGRPSTTTKPAGILGPVKLLMVH